MKLTLPGEQTLRLVGTIVLALVLFAGAFFAISRLWPRENPLPAQLARKDEKTAQGSAVAIGSTVARQNDDATLHIDLTAKDIHDAFRTIPAPATVSQPAGAAPVEPRPLPTAPVDRLRDRLNESIARANRSAGAADAPD